MMTGEIEYNDLYYPQREFLAFNPNSNNGNAGGGGGGFVRAAIDERDVPQFFPFTAHFILTIFILVVAIVIMNLLFGMAVSDVQELYKKSRLHQSIQQVGEKSFIDTGNDNIITRNFVSLSPGAPHCVHGGPDEIPALPPLAHGHTGIAFGNLDDKYFLGEKFKINDSSSRTFSAVAFAAWRGATATFARLSRTRTTPRSLSSRTTSTRPSRRSALRSASAGRGRRGTGAT